MVTAKQPKTVKAEGENTDAEKQPDQKTPAAPRKIPGNLPYLPASGTLKRALERLIDASRPDKFNADYLENILKLSGGAARATIPILKKMGFLSSDGVPTELYAKFRTASGRGAATIQALRNGFPEIFKRSEYAHTVDDAKLKDIIVEITGLKGNDPVLQAIKSTFNALKSFIPSGTDFSSREEDSGTDEGGQGNVEKNGGDNKAKGESRNIGLAYHINIVLPETSDIKVLNAIFRAVKENLL